MDGSKKGKKEMKPAEAHRRAARRARSRSAEGRKEKRAVRSRGTYGENTGFRIVMFARRSGSEQFVDARTLHHHTTLPSCPPPLPHLSTKPPFFYLP